MAPNPEENFETEVLNSDLPVLVDFWAKWCPPCRALAPTIEELAVEFEGTVKVAKLDVDEAGAIAARYGVQSIPTLLFFQGGQVVDQLVGALPKQALVDRLGGLLAQA